MSIKSALANVLVLVVATGIGALLAEAGARIVLDPADYLSVTTERDDILGIRITPGTRGFDEWGFRNPRVPQSADLVAVGDSHTYGNNARMTESWPAVASKATGLGMYNLGLGGYGPNQYYYLLKTRGIGLKPKIVVAAIYMGDDFENAYLMTYGLPYWASLRKGERKGVDANIWEDTSQPAGTGARIRNWLSAHSIVYRVVVHGPLLGSIKGAAQINRAARTADPQTTTLTIPEDHISEAFRPIGIRDRLDQKSAAVVEGMRLTFELLGMMDDLCRENHAQFIVTIIPTKETVFASYLLRDNNLHLRPVIEDLVTNETAATRALIGFLDSRSIAHVEPLDALRGAVTQQLYTRSDRDMHPAANGYRIIGEQVARFIEAQKKPAGQ